MLFLARINFKEEREKKRQGIISSGNMKETSKMKKYIISPTPKSH